MDWREMVRTVAPVLGSALPLPPPLGAMAAKAVTDALLGKDAPANPKEADKALEAALSSGNPDTLVKLKQVEADLKIKMEELGVDLQALTVKEEEIDAGDRASARQMKTTTRSWAPEVISAIVTVGFFYTMGWLLKYGVPREDPSGVVMLLIGALTAGFSTVLNFWLGSSHQGGARSTATRKTDFAA